MSSTEEHIQDHSHLGENGFPKINGKLKDFIYQLQKLKDQQRLPPIVPLLGTVKLHGMHADIVYDLQDRLNPRSSTPSTDNSQADIEDSLSDRRRTLEINDTISTSYVRFQSRNLLCSPESSQHGWPRDVARFPGALSYLKTRILDQYCSRYPGAIIDRTKPLIVAGEWIGTGVQQDVGISQLSPRFIIFGIKLNDMWLADDDWYDIEANKAGIFNIHRVSPFRMDFDTSDISENNYVLLDMQHAADVVEAYCPYAAHFGIPDSRGEGIVWKIGTPEGMNNPKCWFKTKGPISGPEHRIDERSIADRAVRKVTINTAVESWVTARRVEQAFEYLLELDLIPCKESMKQFTNWIVSDVWIEEATEIDELTKQSIDARRAIKTKLRQLAREKYFEQMKGAEMLCH